MPKLNPAKAAEVRKAGEEGSKFTLLPVGLYVVKLMDVESKTSSKGDPMWVWTYETVRFLDGEPKNDKGEVINVSGKEIRYYTVIKETTLWDLDRVFAAYGVEPDADTDDLIGDEIVVMVEQEPITKGKSKGKMGNSISDLMSLADGEAKANDDEYESVEGGSDEEPPF